MSRTFCRSSTTKIVSGACRRAPPRARSCRVPITAVVISSPGMPDCGEHFRFAQPRGAAADRAGANQRLRHLGTLVRLAVRAECLVRAPSRCDGHLADVVFEGVEIEEQGRGRNVAAELHRNADANTDGSYFRVLRECSALPLEVEAVLRRRSRMVPGSTLGATRFSKGDAHVFAEPVRLRHHRLEVVEHRAAASAGMAPGVNRANHSRANAAANRRLVALVRKRCQFAVQLPGGLLGRINALHELLVLLRLGSLALRRLSRSESSHRCRRVGFFRCQGWSDDPRECLARDRSRRRSSRPRLLLSPIVRDADHASVAVEHRAAAIARIGRGVGLDERDAARWCEGR